MKTLAWRQDIVLQLDAHWTPNIHGIDELPLVRSHPDGAQANHIVPWAPWPGPTTRARR